MTDSTISLMEPIQLFEGDCRNILKTIPADSIDLIVTSPPYADARQKQYGGVSPDEYVEWFLPISTEFYRVLNPHGTWILNIKEKCVKGERSEYVLDLIKSLRRQGWRWTEEYIWNKKNAMPGKWSTRFRDAWERLLQFNKSRQFVMYQDAVMVPCQPSTAARIARISSDSSRRTLSATGSPFGRNNAAWIGRDLVYPTNVLSLAAENHNRHHSAVFPESLPKWFVKLFTVEGDTVLDPFMGSGTVGLVCRRLNRRFIGIELQPEYITVARERIFGTSILTSRPKHDRKNIVSMLPLFPSESIDS
jgi:DNA modification methylase